MKVFCNEDKNIMAQTQIRTGLRMAFSFILPTGKISRFKGSPTVWMKGIIYHSIIIFYWSV
jgi:hypothetical protein